MIQVGFSRGPFQVLKTEIWVVRSDHPGVSAGQSVSQSASQPVSQSVSDSRGEGATGRDTLISTICVFHSVSRSFSSADDDSSMAANGIQYSERYYDDVYEYRHVVLPPEITKKVETVELARRAQTRSLTRSLVRSFVHLFVRLFVRSPGAKGEADVGDRVAVGSDLGRGALA